MLLLVLSVILGLIPVVGILLIVLSGWIVTVDGLFTSLILAAIAGIFFLSALLEARGLGLLPFLKRPDPATNRPGGSRLASSRAASVPAAAPPPGVNGVVTESGVVEGVRLYEMPVGHADRSLVSFRADGSPAPRSMVFAGNVEHLRPGHHIRISYKPSNEGNVLLTWE